jgi:DNA-binding transcriptional ArsR family regulator
VYFFVKNTLEGLISSSRAVAIRARVAPYVLEGRAPLPRDLSAVRDRYVRVLAAWDEQYFQLVDPAILRGLEADAASRQAHVGTMAPETLVEAATCGVHFVPQPGPELVLLVPQYHYHPWNVFQDYRGLRVIQYPADALPAVPGEPPPDLLRLTRALSDESRLRILRFLATGPRSFTDVVQFMGLAKSTVHHHMVVLRAAGLVRVHSCGDMTTYSLAPRRRRRASRQAARFLTGRVSTLVIYGGERV